MPTALKYIALALMLTAAFARGSAQVNVPTKGTDFWVGFMQNFIDGMPGETLELFVTSDVATTGTVEIPGQGWSVPFSVTAGATTSLPVPVDLAECRIDNLIEARGVHVTTADTVSVFAMNLEPYTADGTKVLPVSSLGTRYRASAYAAGGNAGAEMLVVATEDNTVLLITPSAPTLAGQPAGVPFEVTLQTGETFLVQAETPNDLTGTLVEAAPSSGSCRPFAVFSGATCASVPTTCAACDHLFEQNFPVPTWGSTYQAVPFLGPDSYTLRVLADQAAMVTVGGIPHTVAAGDFLEINGLTSPECITADVSVQAVQFMEGVECGGVGDPAMLVLNAQEQQIDAVTFSTVDSGIITEHALTVITDATNTGNVWLDGTALSPTLFETFPSCPTRAFARLPLDAGSHTLESDGLFTAYVYGNGFAESYAYSVGSYARVEPEEPTVYCFSTELDLQVVPTTTDVTWFLLPDTLSQVGSGEQLVLPAPFASGTYKAHGTEGISGCPVTEAFWVEYSAAPQVEIGPLDPTVCIHDTVPTTVAVTTDLDNLAVWWSPHDALADTTDLSPELSPLTSTVFTLNVATPGGCVSQQHSYVVEVIEEDPSFELGPDVEVCADAVHELHVALPTDWTYAWNDSGFTGPDVELTATGTYALEVTSPGGCTHADSMALAHLPLPDPGWNPIPAFCADDSTLYAPPNDTWNVTWSDGLTGPRWLVDTSTLTYDITDLAGCGFSGAVSPETFSTPDVFLPDEVYTCEGDQAIIEAIADGVTYLWQDGTSGTSATANAGGFFGLTVTNNLGCTTTDSTWVEVLDRPEVDLGADVILCEGQTALLDAGSTGWTYSWSTGHSGPTLQVSTSGSYTVEASNGFCSDVDQVVVEVVPAPVRPFATDSLWCFEDQPLELHAGNPGYQFLWSNGSAANSTTFNQEGEASLTVTTPLGCTSTFTIDLTAFCNQSALYLPNGFTPDGDGVNDTFGAVGSGIGRFHMTLWNRWGDEVFATDSIEEFWDGRGDRRGKTGESEVYVYQVTYTTLLDHEGRESVPQHVRGFVTVVR